MTSLENELILPKKTEAQEHLLQVLAIATFLIFFQVYMVAPLIPRLAETFGVSHQKMGWVVSAYLIPYGIGSLLNGLLSDRIGRQRIMLTSLSAFILLTSLTATAQSAEQLIAWRSLTGFCASGVIPLILTLIGDIFPYQKRGRAMGWLFGSMAGGMAFGSTFGALLEPWLGWRSLFLGVGALGAAIFMLLLRYRRMLGNAATSTANTLGDLFSTYLTLLCSRRGRQTYSYVLLNGIFHSGVYTWLGLYFKQRYGLGEFGIGLALLGYGVPGFLLGPTIGRAADRWGRSWLIPLGFGVGSLAVGLLALNLPLAVAAIAVTFISLAYDMTQPLLAGIVTSLSKEHGGQAMGLNVFTLFMGFGTGSWIFGEAIAWGFNMALAIFATVVLAAAVLAIRLFRFE